MAKPVKKGSSKPKAKSKVAKRSAALSHTERFDRGRYELPLMDLGEAIALATSLLAVKPGKPTPAIIEEGRHVAAARDRALAVKKAQGGKTEALDARAYDVAMDRAWATFVRRIQDHVELPAEHHGHAPDAARIYAIVRDLSILKLNYLAEFAQIGGHIDALKREGLIDAARQLAGTEFVDEVLRCHGEYGQALGVMGAPAATDGKPADRGEARNALTEAIAEYTVQVMALARAGRPDGWSAVDKALKPIAELRAKVARTHRTHAAPQKHAPHPPVERKPAVQPTAG